MTKQELRKQYLQKRLGLPREEYLSLNQKLLKRFFDDIDFTGVKVLHTFLPIVKNKEPDTWWIIDYVHEKFPDILISVPTINMVSQTMRNSYFDPSALLHLNSLGIPEPKTGAPTPTTDIDLVIVPLLCVDLKGNRVGYGKGYYDKFLKECRPDCKKIGISFFNPIEKIDDVSTLDVPVDGCLTPEKMWWF